MHTISCGCSVSQACNQTLLFTQLLGNVKTVWQYLSVLCVCMQTLNETSREDAEWILWMDLDTVAVESDIAFPLADYEGKDLVLWIQPEYVLEGDAFRTLLLSPLSDYPTVLAVVFSMLLSGFIQLGYVLESQAFCILLLPLHSRVHASSVMPVVCSMSVSGLLLPEHILKARDFVSCGFPSHLW